MTGATAVKDVTDAIPTLLAPLETALQALTAGSGKDVAERATIARRLDTGCCFADPSAYWHRGANENTNRVIQQYSEAPSFLAINDDEVLADHGQT